MKPPQTWTLSHGVSTAYISIYIIIIIIIIISTRLFIWEMTKHAEKMINTVQLQKYTLEKWFVSHI